VNNLKATDIAFGAISICRLFCIEFLYCMQELKDQRPADGTSFVDKIWSDEVATTCWVPSTFCDLFGMCVKYSVLTPFVSLSVESLMLG
jgi:hypothetical protein